METDQLQRICKQKLREDVAHGIDPDSSVAYLTGSERVNEGLRSGKYNCPVECPGGLTELRRIGRLTLPEFFGKGVCGLEVVALAEAEPQHNPLQTVED